MSWSMGMGEVSGVPGWLGDGEEFWSQASLVRDWSHVCQCRLR